MQPDNCSSLEEEPWINGICSALLTEATSERWCLVSTINGFKFKSASPNMENVALVPGVLQLKMS